VAALNQGRRIFLPLAVFQARHRVAKMRGRAAVGKPAIALATPALVQEICRSKLTAEWLEMDASP